MRVRRCYECYGTGVKKTPKDLEIYNNVYDRLDKASELGPLQMREKAYEEAGFNSEKCKECNGSGKINVSF